MKSEEIMRDVNQVPVRMRMTMEQAARLGFISRIANISGRIVGYGYGMIANVITGFSSGFLTGMNIADLQRKQWQLQIQTQQTQQIQEAPQTTVIEEEKIEMKEMKGTG